MAKIKKPTKKAVRERVVDDAPSATGSQADYDAHLPDALKLRKDEVVPLRADPGLALVNLQVGVASVLAEEGRLAALPETDVGTLRALPNVALAVIYAETQVRGAEPTGLAAKFAIAYPLRALLLKSADALASAGLLKRKDVDAVQAGHGKLDAAKDLIALAAVFTNNAAEIKGKHAVSAAQVKQAAELGTELVRLLRPGRAKRGSSRPSIGVNERDRLWTLVVQGHDALWRAGAYLFGRDAVDAKVPPLQSGRGGRPKKPAPGPATPPAGANQGGA